MIYAEIKHIDEYDRSMIHFDSSFVKAKTKEEIEEFAKTIKATKTEIVYMQFDAI